MPSPFPTRSARKLWLFMSAVALVTVVTGANAARGRSSNALAFGTRPKVMPVPSIFICLPNGTHVTSPYVSLTVDVCDNAGTQSVSFTHNGNAIAGSGGANSGCEGAAYFVDVVLTVGSNSFVAGACNTLGACTSKAVTFYYDLPAPVWAVGVTSVNPSITMNVGASTTAGFTVANHSDSTATIQIDPVCTSPNGGIACAVSPPTIITLAPAGTQLVSVSVLGLLTTTATAGITASIPGHGASSSATSTIQVTLPMTVTALSFTADPGKAGFVRFRIDRGEAPTVTIEPLCWNFTNCSITPATGAQDPGGDLFTVNFTVPIAEEGKVDSVSLSISNGSYGSRIGTKILTVTQRPVNSVTVTLGATTIHVDSGTTRSATVFDEWGNPLAGRLITWTVEPTSVAKQTGPLVTGVGAGVATVTATSEGKSGSAALTVTGTVTLASLLVTPTTVSLQPGASVALSAQATMSNSTTQNVTAAATWSSNDTTVARATSGGATTAASPGSATITASYQGLSASASVTVPAPPPPPPDPLTLQVIAPSSTVPLDTGGIRTEVFMVRNTSTAGSAVPLVISRTCGANTNPATCSVSPASMSLAPGGSLPVTLTFKGGAIAGNLAHVVVTATSGSVSANAALDVPLQLPPKNVDLRVHGYNTESAIARDECVSIAVSQNAAYECGDLRVVHPLPVTVAANKTFVPRLLYNSRFASPGTVVHGRVKLGSIAPNKLKVTVKVPAYSRTVEKTFTWDTTCAAKWCQVSMGVDAKALSLPTGLYKYTMEVKALRDTTLLGTGLDSAEFVIVDRSLSSFGAGWWLEGLETLMPVGSDYLWIGGDGSTQLYRFIGNDASQRSIYLAKEPMERPDTLMRYVSGSWITERRLRNGGYVRFDPAGRQIETSAGPAGLRPATRFTWSSGGANLDSLILPMHPMSPDALAYVFSWGGGPYGNLLSQVEAPKPASNRDRITSIHSSAGYAIDSIRDPDGRATLFSYDNRLTTVRLTSRTNKRGDAVSFAYDALGAFRGATITMRTGPSITHTICPQLILGALTCNGDSLSWRPRQVDSLLTIYDGPRTDVTDVRRIFENRFGMPDTIVDPIGQRTRLWRHGTYPAVVETIIDASGLRTQARINSRGLADSVTTFNPLGDGSNATTRYTYDPKWDRTTRITSPLNRPTNFGVDLASGLTVYGQPGAADSTRTNVSYVLGLPQVVNGYGGYSDMRTTFAYDWRLNLVLTTQQWKTLSGLQRDAAGLVQNEVTYRDTTGAGDFTDSTETRHYRDIMSRDTLLVSSAGRRFNCRSSGVCDVAQPETAFVRTTYDEEGLPLRVTRWATGDTSSLSLQRSASTTFTYDALGRVLTKNEDDLGSDVVYFDAAGNDTLVVTRRNLSIRKTFDALNQLRIRRTQSVSAGRDVCLGCVPHTAPGSGNVVFPRFPWRTIGGGWDSTVTLAGDSASFEYDAVGRLVRADNREARIHRAYYPGGALKTDSIYFASFDAPGQGLTAPAFLGAHVYGITYTYDLDGRRTTMTDPGGLAVQSYAYSSAAAGPLTSTTYLGFSSTFSFRKDGTLHAWRGPTGSGGGEQFGYDDEGNRKLRLQVGAGGSFVFSDSARIGELGRTVERWSANGSSAFYAYSGLGHLFNSTMSPAGYQAVTERLDVDALANISSATQDFGIAGYEKTISRRYRHHRVMSDSIEPGLMGKFNGEDPATKVIGVTKYAYDSSGNQTKADYLQAEWDEATNTQFLRSYSGHYWTRMYYDTENRLRVYQRSTKGASYLLQTVQQEYRYDALGRRIAVRTQREGFTCSTLSVTAECQQTMERFVWDGDQVLMEVRGDGTSSLFGSALDGYSGSNAFLGEVRYVHALGIDQPLAVRRDVGNDLVVLQRSWQGEVVAGRLASTGQAVTTPSGSAITWPGEKALPYGAKVRRLERAPANYWFGNLLDQNADASGLFFRRNRYYDPQTGRFTQEDPIGLAGGMNLYGYANGDPVNYSDPFGLCPACAIVDAIADRAWNAGNERKISRLDPEIQRQARVFVNLSAAAGSEIGIVSGFRSSAEQDVLFAQGRTTPGPKVTWARGGQSYHNFGLAIDVAPVQNGRLNPAAYPAPSTVEIGRAIGFEWGGDWSAAKKDRPHFQITGGRSPADLNRNRP